MTHSFPSFPAPSDKVVELARQDVFDDRSATIRACLAYRAEATATLLDGTVVRPTISLARNVAKSLRMGMPAFAVAVEEGFYITDETYNIGRDYP